MSARDTQFRSSRAQSRGDSTKFDKRPSTSLGTSGQEAGFTLLEMLVALAVFSLAALALLRLEGATVRQTGELDERMLAQLVARNLAVETLTDPAPPPLGASIGETVNGGRRWRWSRVTSRTPDQQLVRIDISVATSRTPSVLTIVRPAT